MKKSCIHLMLIGSLMQTTVWADVTVVQNFTLDNLTGPGTLEAQRILQIHGTSSRKETKVQLRGDLPKALEQVDKDVTLVSLDKGVVQKLDSRKKVYEEVPLSRWRTYWESQSAAAPASSFVIVQAWSRKVSGREFQIVNGRRCRKLVYELHLGALNLATQGRKDYCVRTTLWMADPLPEIKKSLDEENAFLRAFRRKVGGASPDDLNRVGLMYAAQVTGLDEKTLGAALSKAMSYMRGIRGYLVSSQTEWFLEGFKGMKPLFVVKSETESFSHDPLPTSVFSISKKFSQVPAVWNTPPTQKAYRAIVNG